MAGVNRERLSRCVSEVIIPARLESTRLPQEMLLSKTGQPLILHTYEAASRAKLPHEVCVATDSQEVFQAVHDFGGKAVMTRKDHTCGTDRVAEVAAGRMDTDIVVNVQGDEPEVSGESIDLAVRILETHLDVPMSTLATPIRDKRRLDDAACVKVVIDNSMRGIYFSRSPIPFAREWNDELLSENPPHFYQHIGLCAYRREFLLELTEMPTSDLERLESLEQLRVIQAGIPIQVGIVSDSVKGIDTEEDYGEFVERCRVRRT